MDDPVEQNGVSRGSVVLLDDQLIAKLAWWKALLIAHG